MTFDIIDFRFMIYGMPRPLDLWPDREWNNEWENRDLTYDQNSHCNGFRWKDNAKIYRVGSEAVRLVSIELLTRPANWFWYRSHIAATLIDQMRQIGSVERAKPALGCKQLSFFI